MFGPEKRIDDEAPRLLFEILLQGRGQISDYVDALLRDECLAESEPLRSEPYGSDERLLVVEHALDLALEAGRRNELARSRRVEEGVVGHGAPEQVAQAARDLPRREGTVLS